MAFNDNRFFILLLAFILRGSTLLTAQSFPVLVLTEKPKDSLHLWDYMSVYKDTTEQMTLQTVQNQIFTSLDKHPRSYFSVWLKDYLWYHYAVQNPTRDTIVLAFNFMGYENITLHQFVNQKELSPLHFGIDFKEHPQPQKIHYRSNASVLLTFPPYSHNTFYIKCKGSPDDKIEPTLFAPAAEASFFMPQLIKSYAWQFSFLAILTFVFITSLINYFQHKHAAFLYYCGYITVQWLFYYRELANYDQFIRFAPDWFMTSYASRIPLAWGWLIFYTLFIDSFLELRSMMPKAHRFICFLTYLYLFSIISAEILWLIDHKMGYAFILILRKTNVIMGLSFNVVMFFQFKKYPIVRYIIAGTISYLIGSVCVQLTETTNHFWDNGLIFNQLGILVELVFFSAGLAYKSQADATEKERYLRENKELTLEKNLSLANMRNEVAQDIHDEVGAGLTKISLSAAYLERLPTLSEQDVKEKAKKLGEEAQHLRTKLKEIVFAINPEYDDFADMQAYFRAYTVDFWADTPVLLHFDFEKSPQSPPSVSPNVKRHLLHIFIETQNNAAKYAQATQMDLTLKLTNDNCYTMIIKDNGRGFDPLSKKGYSKGISGILQRAEHTGATCAIESTLGKGTTVRIEGCL
ncbi:MAG: 7TM diverse intracellular signaling domain-containing protein [Saprospiraceae bacterium]|nr:7TM diverse intracellular signaling domain-containing protein [Saprospiraceae bacterium]